MVELLSAEPCCRYQGQRSRFLARGWNRESALKIEGVEVGLRLVDVSNVSPEVGRACSELIV